MQSGPRRRGDGSFRFLRRAHGARGAFPGGELVGVAAVFVLDGGVEAGDDGLGVAEEGLDGGGAFDAFEVVAVFAGVAVGECVAVGAEIFDEVGGEFVGDEFGAQRGLGGELGRGVGGGILEEFQEGIRVGGDGDLAGCGGVAVNGIVEGGFIELDGAGGAGDVLEVEREGLDEDGLANGAPELADAGGGEFEDDGIEIEEESGGLAAGGELRGIVAAEGLNTGGALEAADVAVVHGELCFLRGEGGPAKRFLRSLLETGRKDWLGKQEILLGTIIRK